MRFLPAGDTALLVELDDLAQTMAFYRQLRAEPIPGIRELTPAARTLLVHYRSAAVSAQALIQTLCERFANIVSEMTDEVTTGRLVEVPVHYNGEDLPEVADMLGITVSEVIARHTAQPYLAAFAGFAPGFVYLANGHPDLRVPRRQSPRTRVPAGSVALAGDFSAVYPTDSPGGWQLLGVTEIPMWDLQREEPAYIQPGFRVQFINADAARTHISLPQAVGSAVSREAAPVATKSTMVMAPVEMPVRKPFIAFLRTGLQTLAQDEGRHGMSELGISPSGALDTAAMRQANDLVGNPTDTPVLENVLGDVHMRCHGQAVIAVTGADVPLTLKTAQGHQWTVEHHRAIALDDGDLLQIGVPTAGLRCYLAVRGGWQVTPVLGSCATDTLARLGPPPITAGQQLAVGQLISPKALRAVALDVIPRQLPRAQDVVTLDVIFGPRADWFTSEAIDTFLKQEWLVTPQSNRVGVRLQGATALTRSRHDELPSEGTVTGAIQVPANGQPVLFLADHPLTGGYPVIATVASHHLYLAAQLPIGCRVRFQPIAHPFEGEHARLSTFHLSSSQS